MLTNADTLAMTDVDSLATIVTQAGRTISPAGRWRHLIAAAALKEPFESCARSNAAAASAVFIEPVQL